MEEPGRLQSMGSLRVGHDSDFAFAFHFHALEKEMATHSSVLACCLAVAAAVIYVKCVLLVVAENGSFSYFCSFLCFWRSQWCWYMVLGRC